jgi:hypothetical protein
VWAGVGEGPREGEYLFNQGVFSLFLSVKTQIFIQIGTEIIPNLQVGLFLDGFVGKVIWRYISYSVHICSCTVVGAVRLEVIQFCTYYGQIVLFD